MEARSLDSNKISAVFRFVIFGLLSCAALSSEIGHASAKKPQAAVDSLGPAAAQPVIPTPEQIAAELGFPVSDLPKLAADFSNALSLGVKSKEHERICSRDEKICEVLSDYYAQREDGKRERRRRKRSRRVRVHVEEKTLAKVQAMDFQLLINSVKIRNEKEFLKISEIGLKHGECPRNLSAALTVQAEEYFPDESVRERARELFEHARACLTNEEPAYERLMLRRGLYAIKDGQTDLAVELLEKAATAKAPREEYRSLYWLGKIAFDKSSGSNKYWEKLLVEYPMSYYAIDASVRLGRDPVTVITSHKPGGFSRKVAGLEDLNREILWLEALYTYKKFGAVARWASWMVRSEDDLDVDVLNYISAVKIASGLYRSNISMLFSYFKKNPESLNREGLMLLYPRPYYDIIREASKDKIDTFLVLGLVRQESAFDPHAVSRARAKGLMQIIPHTARRLASGGHRKLLNPEANANMGVKYLTRLAGRFGGDMELVLASYNAGPNKVDEWLKRNPAREDSLLWNDLIPYMETRDYVVSILRNTYFYYRLYHEESIAQAPKVSDAEIYGSSMVRNLIAKSL